MLNDSQPASYVLAAYCIQFRKENPSSTTRFILEPPDPVLACIAGDGSSLTIPAMQAAVWMQTDHVGFAQMTHKFPVSEQEWAAGRSVFRDAGIRRRQIRMASRECDDYLSHGTSFGSAALASLPAADLSSWPREPFCVSGQNVNPQVSISPAEDARLPILEAEIEREWRRWRPKYVRDLKARGKLQHQIRETALWYWTSTKTADSARIRDGRRSEP